MALFSTNTANLSSHTHAFRSYNHPFNRFPSAKQSNHNNLVRRIKLNSVSAELGEVKKAYREKRRNVKQKNWAEQIESLRMRSRSGERKTWGEKMRRSREEMAAH
ncbi:hypothetical protein SUGI_0023300 [Cryptomeria japonica]|nr:hypothetical protein SUGI_0023300 [Cryptomeria japonica]